MTVDFVVTALISVHFIIFAVLPAINVNKFNDIDIKADASIDDVDVDVDVDARIHVVVDAYVYASGYSSSKIYIKRVILKISDFHKKRI